MNKIILKGRLTADPEIRSTTNEVAVCNFSIAVNRKYDKNKADFINCEAWRTAAEFIKKYFSKGKEICVVGELHIDKWEKDGENRYLTKVVVDEVEFCGNKQDAKEEPASCFGAVEVVADENLPF